MTTDVNLGLYMICSMAWFFLIYTIQVGGKDRGRVGGVDDKGNAILIPGAKPGGWYSAYSNLGAPELLMSAFLFALWLTVPLDWLSGLLGSAGETGVWMLVMRLAGWAVLFSFSQRVFKNVWSIEALEAWLGPLLPWAVALYYANGNAAWLKLYIDLVARAFGVTGGGA